MAVLRKILGDSIPEAEQIIVPKWSRNWFQRGSYSMYPDFVDEKHFENIRVKIKLIAYRLILLDRENG